MTHGIIEEGLRAILSPDAAEGTSCPAADLYRYAAGEATAAEAAAFEAHLASCQECSDDLGSFRALAQGSEKRAGLGAWARQWLRAAASWPARRRRLMPVFAAAAAAATLVGLVIWQSAPLWPDTPNGGDGRLHVKGAYRLHAALERGGKRFVAASGDVVQPGDVLGFFYSAPRATYVVLLAASSDGMVAQAYPEGEQRLLAGGAEQRLATGAVVEPGGECEWVVAFFGATPLDVATLRPAVEAAVRAAGKDCALPPISVSGAAVDVLALRKTRP